MPLAKLKSKTNSVKHSMISKNEVTENHNFRLMKMGRVHIRRAIQNELGASVFGKKKGSQGVNTQSIQKLSFFPLLKIYTKTVRTSLGTRYTTAKLRYMWHLYTGHMENHASTVTTLMHSTCHLQVTLLPRHIWMFSIDSPRVSIYTHSCKVLRVLFF